ncbi:ABC transporter permease [Paenibacillus sp. EC2-1]|uniref:ABC transporter permease n=1 Tax=Paenibacillus sp. EC2-1 TaxID=3388665 RepID=UPI003BEED209
MKYIYESIRMELILLRRNPIFCSLPALYVVMWVWLLVRYELGGDGQGSRSYYFYDSWILHLPTAVLLAGLFSVYILYKDRISGLEILERTWPQSSIRLILGKWIIAQIYGLFFTLPTVAIQGIWMGLRGDHKEPIMLFLSYTFIQMSVAIFMFVSLGMLIAVLLRHKLSFVLLTMLWIIPVIVYQFSQSETSSIHVISRWFAPYDMTRFRYNPVMDSWGLLGVNWTAIHQIVIALLGLLFLGLTCLFADHGRTLRDERTKLIIYSAVVSVSVISVGWVSYDEFLSRVNRYVDDGTRYMVKDVNALVDKNGLANVHSDFQTTEMDLNVQLSEPNQLQVKSELLLVQTEQDQSSIFHLTLNHQLVVTDIQSDQPLEWNRSGDVLEVHTATPIENGEAIRLKLNYSGAIDTYRSEGVKQYSGISKDYVLLPKSIAWYPQIGQRELSVSIEHNNTTLGFLLKDSLDYREPGSTRYHVSVTGRNGNMVLPLPVTNREQHEYSGSNSNGLYIYQGVTEERSVNGTRIIDHPDVIEYSVRHFQHQQDQINYLNDWLGLNLQTADLYSGYIFYGGNLNHFSLTNDSFKTRFPREEIHLPAVKPLLLEGLLNWVYEREYPMNGRAWGASFRSYYVNFLPSRGPARVLSPMEEQVVKHIDQASSDWERIVTLSGQMYSRYLAVGSDQHYNPLQELEQLLANLDEDHLHD